MPQKYFCAIVCSPCFTDIRNDPSMLNGLIGVKPLGGGFFCYVLFDNMYVSYEAQS